MCPPFTGGGLRKNDQGQGVIERVETKRLVLRPLRPADADELHGVLGDAKTMAYYPRPFSQEETRAWIDWNLKSYEEHGFGLYAIDFEGSLIGDCGLTIQQVDSEPVIEVGWHVRRDMWGRGFATEAGEFWRDRALRDMRVDRLVSIIRPENKASRRVAEKLGLEVWKETLRGPGWLHYVYSITRGPDQGPSGSRNA